MSISKQECKVEIFIAIERGDADQVKRMIDAYPDLINYKSSSSANPWTPLTFAVRYGQLEVVRTLVESGADIKLKNPLSVAQYGQDRINEVIRYLLEKGANPNIYQIFQYFTSIDASDKLSEMKRGDLLRLVLLHGYVYEYKYGYIDKETKLQVSKTVRFNDPGMLMQRKLIHPLLVPEPLNAEQEATLKQLREVPPGDLS